MLMGDISFVHGLTKVPSVAVLVVHVRYDSNPKTKSEGMAL